ncbi:hypothetical protein, partial [Streptomyces prasinus]
GAYEVVGGLGPGGECGRRVPLGLLDLGGDPGDPVGGGTVSQRRLGGLPGRVQGAGVGEFTLLGGGGRLGRRQRQSGVP